jgi:acyl-CoA reductase-like NAD-dependent aldehyde dehydrogenase
MADTDIVCISPIDGREFARRPLLSDAAVEGAIADAREAQRSWRAVPLEERKALVLRFLDELLAMNQEVVPELAGMMGRPVRFGGEFRGVEERTRHMVRIADASLADMSPDDDRPGLRRVVK